MRQRHGAHAYGFMPPTFVLPEEHGDFEDFMREGASTALWILKPAAAQCGGGITIHDAQHPPPPPVAFAAAASAVASAYIHPPYLLDGLKFDLRLYVLVTRWQPTVTAYVHTSGIVRRATELYDTSRLGCRQAHLANYAVNKGSSKFVVCGRPSGGGQGAAGIGPEGIGAEGIADGRVADDGGGAEGDGGDEGGGGAGGGAYDGSIWTLATFRRRLEAELGDEGATRVWAEVDDLIAKTLLAAAPTMRQQAAAADQQAAAADQQAAAAHQQAAAADQQKDSQAAADQQAADRQVGSSPAGWSSARSIRVSEADLRGGVAPAGSEECSEAAGAAACSEAAAGAAACSEVTGVAEGSEGAGVAPRAARRACGSTQQCFQLLGFDVMLDGAAKPWLLEVNGDPGLRTESAVFLDINAPMVADLLNLIGVRPAPTEEEDGTETRETTAFDVAEEIEAEARRYAEQTGWRRLLPGVAYEHLVDVD